jgi:hypothetical protein
MEVLVTELSLAIELIDDFTDRQPIGEIKVVVKEQNIQALRNRSGYHLFLAPDLPEGDHKVQVRSLYYFDEKTNVTLPLETPQSPVKIILKPKPSYPFPSGATLLRGIVQGQDGSPVSGATVTAKLTEGKEVSNQTSEKGEFALYFKALTEEDIEIVDGKKFVKGEDGTESIELEVNTQAVPVQVEEGKTTSLGSPIVLS